MGLVEPVLDGQAGDAFELADVCRYYGGRQCAGVRGDQQVVRSDRAAGGLQFGADATILAVSRDIARVKSRLQRLSPVTEQTEYNRMFGDLVALEQRRKVLSDRAAGAL